MLLQEPSLSFSLYLFLFYTFPSLFFSFFHISFILPVLPLLFPSISNSHLFSLFFSLFVAFCSHVLSPSTLPPIVFSFFFPRSPSLSFFSSRSYFPAISTSTLSFYLYSHPFLLFHVSPCHLPSHSFPVSLSNPAAAAAVAHVLSPSLLPHFFLFLCCTFPPHCLFSFLLSTLAQTFLQSLPTLFPSLSNSHHFHFLFLSLYLSLSPSLSLSVFLLSLKRISYLSVLPSLSFFLVSFYNPAAALTL
ncbi:unnamed protein product [Acanthosepion pharaonis]|uniref:Uncharacterized protein n=1 Tax=Acanthosepion pharaonis TaxID=158019 RepID=A0A812C6D2_ACAPH|nr:unnamed protein product [Sepia pharaonis]